MNALQRLQQTYPKREARAIYELVMERRFGLSRTDVLMGKDTTLSANDKAELQNIIGRLQKNEPVQYVLGTEMFCGHEFRVTGSVLIPRPETQLLVELAVRTMPRGSSILDVGTGSGCIAISLALAGFRATAFDVSREALDVASENAHRLKADVQFVRNDILHPATTDEMWDAVISNPPYICQREAKTLEENVLRYEPHLALFVPDEDPLLFYRAIAVYGLKHIYSGGCIFFEVNRLYSQEVKSMLIDLGYDEVEVMNDQFDNERIVYARRR